MRISKCNLVHQIWTISTNLKVFHLYLPLLTRAATPPTRSHDFPPSATFHRSLAAQLLNAATNRITAKRQISTARSIFSSPFWPNWFKLTFDQWISSSRPNDFDRGVKGSDLNSYNIRYATKMGSKEAKLRNVTDKQFYDVVPAQQTQHDSRHWVTHYLALVLINEINQVRVIGGDW